MKLCQLAEFPDLPRWPQIAGGMPTQTHAWMQARAGLLPPGLPIRLYAVESGGRLQALAPLCAAGGWLRELPAMFEPSDLIAVDEPGLAVLADGLAAQPLPLYLERLPLDSATLPALRRAYRRRGLVQIQPAMPTPLIRLERPIADIDALFNARRRADFRRAERRAARFGDLRYQIQAPADAAELTRLLAEAYAMEAKSWKAAAGTALSADWVQGEFFRRFCRAAMQEGMLRIALLRLGDRTAAMQIACEWQQRFWLFKISHDLAFADCSPGQLLMRHTLQYAAGGGLQAYEFMGGMDGWTRLWTRDVREYCQVRAAPFGLAAMKMAAKSAVRTLRGRL